MSAWSRHMTPEQFYSFTGVALEVWRAYSEHEQEAAVGMLDLAHQKWNNLTNKYKLANRHRFSHKHKLANKHKTANAASEAGVIAKTSVTPPIKDERGSDGAIQMNVNPETALATSNTHKKSDVTTQKDIKRQISGPQISGTQTKKRKRNDDAKDVASKTSGSQTKKRKVDDDVKEVASKGKRLPHAVKERDNKQSSVSTSLGHHFRRAVRAREEGMKNSDYAVVRDAILPDNSHAANLRRPEIDVPTSVTPWESEEKVGDLTGLHPEEIWVCQQLAITGDVYRCQKAQIFLGLALFTEYNHQLHQKQIEKPSFLRMGKAQFQLFGSIDANKLSALFDAFTAWGWVGEAKQTWKSTETLCERFPEAHRRKLVQEVFDWERRTLPRESWVADF